MNAFGDDTTLTSLFGLGIMFLGLVVITGAAILEHRTGKPNFIMTWLWRQ
jgi:hypothetical protein